MGFFDKLRPKKAAPSPAEASASSAAVGGSFASINDKAKKRQQLLLATVGAAVLLPAGWWVLKDDNAPASATPADGAEYKVQIATDDMVARNVSQREWITTSGNQLSRQGQEIKTTGTQVAALEKKVAELEAARSADRVDAQRALQIYENENRALAAKAATAPKSEPFRVAGGATPAAPPYGPAGGGYDAQARPMPAGGAPMAGGAAMMPPPAEVRIISFSAAPKGQGAGDDGARGTGDGVRTERPDAPPTVVEDSPEYLPPNSYAPARVIVGVDASAGVQSQTDPLPVVLRITGPARSVVSRGRLLTTRIEGCVVNGAARGDLSAEKVYVKLAKMTCDQPGGRVAVSEVKGFISFAGKAGVRGRVVSREGNLVGQAFVAGLAGGLGRAFTLNTQAALTGGQTIVNGRRQPLGAGDIAGATIGGGVSQGADTVSKYLIERAEQYQPVIEMPTGIDVEIVFLDGVYVRGGRQ